MVTPVFRLLMAPPLAVAVLAVMMTVDLALPIDMLVAFFIDGAVIAAQGSVIRERDVTIYDYRIVLREDLAPPLDPAEFPVMLTLVDELLSPIEAGPLFSSIAPPFPPAVFC